MPQWIVDVIRDPLAVTALGGALLVPLLNFLANLFVRSTPAPTPVIDDRQIAPDRLIVPWKSALSEEESEWLEEIHKSVEKIDNKVTLLHDRMSLMILNKN